MKNKIFALGVTSMFLLAGVAALHCIAGKSFEIKKEGYGSSVARNNNEIICHVDRQDNGEDGWYNLSKYDNYAPSGLPDFSQLQQDDWGDRKGHVNLCGAVALADILWWFDSKHSDSNGTPGDGNDTYSLVRDYSAPGTPNPGPHSDDHNFNNVNDNQTPWCRFRRNGELIEQIAWYTNRQKDTIRYEILGPLKGLFNAFKLLYGIKKLFIESGLQNYYSVKPIFKPSFSTINKCLRNNSGIILGMSGPGYDSKSKLLPFQWGHFVAVAGINSVGYIALSDPVQDVMNSSSDPSEHNNASIVSHDVWQVNFTSPYPWLASWWLPEYFGGAFINGAIIISEID